MCGAANLCFILSAAVIGLPHYSMIVFKISHLITRFKIDSSFFEKRFPWLFHKSNRLNFLGVYRAINPLGMLEEHSKSL